MKNTLKFIAVLGAFASFAQAPNSFTYQGIATNAKNVPFASRNLSFRISILATSTTGTADYTETFSSIQTTANGVFALNIGSGTATTGTFAAINWAANAKFLKVELDTNNATNYQAIGTPTQLQSVPFALQATNTAKI